MKKLLLILVIVLGLLIAGVAVFIATFDADRYRPLIVAQLQKALDRPVTLSHISLGWRRGVADEVQGFEIGEGTAAREPLVHIEAANALVRFGPLLHKDVQITSLVFRHPRVHVVRDPQGQVNLLGLAATAGPAAGSGQRARVGDTTVSFRVGVLRIEDGELHWTDALTRPPTDLRLKAVHLTVKDISLDGPMDLALTGALAGEVKNLEIHGRFTPPGAGRQGALEHFTFALTGVTLEQLLSSVRPGDPQLRGRLTLTCAGDITTLDPARLVQAVTGSGHLKLEEPMVANLNVLRDIFQKFSMLPGLMERLQTRLPPEYQAKLAARDTVLLPVDVTTRVEHGALRFDHLELGTDSFKLMGAGIIGLTGAVSLSMRLRIEPALSAAIIQSVKELEVLNNASGELEVPLVIAGQAPKVAIVPDLQYLASKILATKAVDLLDRLLEKTSGDSQVQPPAQPGATGGTKPSTEGDLLGRLIQRAIQKNLPSKSPSQ